MPIKAEISAAIEAFRWNEAEYQHLLRIPVMADLVRRAIKVEAAAKHNATDRPGPRVRTDRLRGSITWRPGQDVRSPYVDIGTSVFYAPFLEHGTSRMQRYPFLEPALQAARY